MSAVRARVVYIFVLFRTDIDLCRSNLMLTAFVGEIFVTVTADPEFRVAHFTAGCGFCFHVCDLDRGGVDLPRDVLTALGTILTQCVQGYVILVGVISGSGS